MKRRGDHRLRIDGRDYVKDENGKLLVISQKLECTDAGPLRSGGGDHGIDWRCRRTIRGEVWLNADRIGLAGLLVPGAMDGQISITSMGEGTSRTEITVLEYEGPRRGFYADLDLVVSVSAALPGEIFDSLWLAVLGGAGGIHLLMDVDLYTLEDPPIGEAYCDWYVNGSCDESGRIIAEPVEGRVIEANATRGESPPVTPMPSPIMQPPMGQPPIEELRAARTIRWVLPAILLALALLFYIKLTR